MNPVVGPGDLDRTIAGRRGRDELDQLEAATARLVDQGCGFLDRQVGNDQAVQPGGGRVVQVAFHPDAVDDRIRDHRHDRRLVEPCRAFGPECAQGLEDMSNLDAALSSAR